MMPCTRIYVDPTAALMIKKRKKRPSNPSKTVMKKIKGQSSFFIIMTSKDNTLALKNSENRHSTRQDTRSEGHFLVLYIITDLKPPPCWTFPFNPFPPVIQSLPPPSSVQFYLPPLLVLVP